MLVPSPLWPFYLCKSLGSRSKANATIAGKRKKQQKIATQKDTKSLSNTARRWKEKGNNPHSPLATEHLTQASKLLSWGFFYSYWRERSIQEGFTLKSWFDGKIDFFVDYSGKKSGLAWCLLINAEIMTQNCICDKIEFDTKLICQGRSEELIKL